MIVIFLSKKGNRGTIEKIREELDEKSYFCVSEKEVRKIVKDNNTSQDEVVLIRWGTTKLSGLRRTKITLNSRGAIRRTSNKGQFRQYLDEAGIPVPKVLSYRDMSYPCIGRTANHSMGRGFWLCENEAQYEKAEREGARYFSPFYDKEREFRVHLSNEEVFFVQEKINGDKEQKVWNHANGFEFKILRKTEHEDELVKAVISIAKNAFNHAGLSFGAVDVMTSSVEEKKVVVCEINTAPACHAYGAVKYAQFFNGVFKNTREW